MQANFESFLERNGNSEDAKNLVKAEETEMIEYYPGFPAATPLIEDGKVVGVRCQDAGVDKDGNPKSLSLFPIYPEKAGIDKETGEVMYDNIPVERYFADCSNGDFFLVQHRNTQRFLWAYSSFFE